MINKPNDLRYHSSDLVNAQAKGVITHCIEQITKEKIFEKCSIILTGSFARAEATVVEQEGKTIFMSDIEFLVVIDKMHNFSKKRREIKRIEKAVSQDIADKGLKCSIEFTLAAKRFFKNAKPCIFNHELKEHGKVLYGDSDIIEMMSYFRAGDIPQVDAFYLLNNRIIEQLESFYGLSSSGTADKEFMYSILKMYVDIATSILVFNNSYRSTYSERKEMLCAIGDCQQFPGLQELLKKCDYWSQMKLSPDPDLLFHTSVQDALAMWYELAQFVFSIWIWELNLITDAKTNYQQIRQEEFMSKIKLYHLIKQWVKILYIAASSKTLSDMAYARVNFKNPRHGVYVNAAHQYFITAKIKQNHTLRSTDFIRFFPFRTLDTLTNKEKVKEIVRIWKTYFRNF